jgi:hypothetical protein
MAPVGANPTLTHAAGSTGDSHEARPLRAKLQRMPEPIGGFLTAGGTSLAWRVQKPAGKAR